MSFDPKQLMQQVQRMQADMQKAQEELANEQVEGTAGGGMVTVTANGSGEIVRIKLAREAVDPEDVEMLEDLVLAAVNEATRAAAALQQQKLGNVAGGMGGLGGLGLPGL
jgi:DNA-binding YbaB/EbfC family protein